MGNLATSQKTSQATTNQQVGVQGTAASGASGTIGKGAAQAVGGGISLVFNTGNNKITSKDTVGNSAAAKPKGKKGKAAAAIPTATTIPASTPGAADDSANSASNQAGGNIAVHIEQTDQGAVQAGTSVSLASLALAQHANDALLQSNTNAVTLAALALQAGEDVAAVAIPTYAANAIVDRPADLAGIQAGTDQAGIEAGVPTNNTAIIFAVVAISISLALTLGKKGA